MGKYSAFPTDFHERLAGYIKATAAENKQLAMDWEYVHK